MEVLYTYDTGSSAKLKTYVDPQSNTMQFGRDRAERIAKRIADHGGYARVVFGTDTMFEAGLDPR